MASIKVIGKIFEWGYKHVAALYLTLIVFTNYALLLDYKFETNNASAYDIAILAFVVPLAFIHWRNVIVHNKFDSHAVWQSRIYRC